MASGAKSPLHSVESRALTHLESIGLGNAAFISMGGPQAHWELTTRMSVKAMLRQLPPGFMFGIDFQDERNASVDRGTPLRLRVYGKASLY